MLIKVTIRAQKTNSALDNDVTIKLNSNSVLVTNVTINEKKNVRQKKAKKQRALVTNATFKPRKKQRACDQT